MHSASWWGNLKEEDLLKDLGIDSTIRRFGDDNETRGYTKR